jgi:exosortase
MQLPSWQSIPTETRSRLAVIAAICMAILWSTWSILTALANLWQHDPTYSHGYLVPLTALAILWFRRDSRPELISKPPWWSLGLFALGAALQLCGAILYVRTLSGASLVAYAAGIAAIAGGWRGLVWATPAVLFLFFMIPLPYRFEGLMRLPLQRISTVASAFAMQTLGLTAYSQGNIINLTDGTGHTYELGVIDACSGLKMLIVFFCLTTAVAILVERSIGERLLILLSTLPIALFCNIARITATGILYVVAGEKWANLVFHDLAGWLMMPLALLLLWLELKLMDAILVDESPTEEVVFRMPGGPTSTPRNVPSAS